MTLFINSVPEDMQAALQNFLDSRKRVEANHHILQLEKVIQYFEIFLFVWQQPSSSPYYLSEYEKNNMKMALSDAISSGLCEIGIITRFEEIIHNIRQDQNWMVQCLY